MINKDRITVLPENINTKFLSCILAILCKKEKIITRIVAINRTATETPKRASKIGNNSFSLLLILNLKPLENPKPLKNPNKIDPKKPTLSFFITWLLRFKILSIDIANKLRGIKNLIISKFVFTSKEILKINAIK